MWLQPVECAKCGLWLKDFYTGLAHLHDVHNHVPQLFFHDNIPELFSNVIDRTKKTMREGVQRMAEEKQPEKTEVENFQDEVAKRIDDPNFDTRALMLTANSGLGKAILKEAVKKHQKEHSERLVGCVHDIMERVTAMEQLKQKTEKRLEFLHKQLNAINNGEFVLSERTGLIKFNDADLNTIWDATEKW